MNNQGFILIDKDSGHIVELKTVSEILASDVSIVIPEKNGTLALVADIEDLRTKLTNGDIAIVASDSNKLDGKDSSEFALKSEIPAIPTTPPSEIKVAMTANNIDLATGNLFTKTLTANTTFTVSNVEQIGNVSSFILELTNGGAFTTTFWTGVKWSGGTKPTFTTAGVDILGFYSYDGGNTWRGMLLSKDSK